MLDGSSFSRRNIFILCATYFLYFGQLGVLTPYLGIFLDGRGFSSVDIGKLLAIITLARIVGPTLWANLSDKSGDGVGVLRLGCGLTVLSFVAVFWVDGFWLLTLVFGLMMMFWTAVLPQLEVITMQCVANRKGGYGNVRLWGSIGFIVLTVGLGKALDVFSSEAPVYASMMVLSLLFVSSLFIKQPARAEDVESHQTPILPLLFRKPFVIFIFSASMLQMSFGAYYGFFALYLRDLGYSGQETGLFIALGVLAEVGIFLIARRLISRFGVKTLLFTCLLLTSLRWYMLADYAHVALWVFVSQLVHALSFGLNHSASVHFIYQYFPAHCQSRGQAIYISVAFGIGGAIGNYIAGLYWQQGEGAFETFFLAAVFAMIGTLSLLFVKGKAMEHSASHTTTV